MTQKEKILQNSETFVREMAKKMDQKLNEKILKKVARKVSKSVTVKTDKQRLTA
jgi:low affinity Fe/Cu permease